MNEKFSIGHDAELNRRYGRVYTQKIEKRLIKPLTIEPEKELRR